jgi:hypothetical protein
MNTDQKPETDLLATNKAQKPKGKETLISLILTKGGKGTKGTKNNQRPTFNEEPSVATLVTKLSVTPWNVQPARSMATVLPATSVVGKCTAPAPNPQTGGPRRAAAPASG